MFETKAECEQYIRETYGDDYLRFDIVVAQKIVGMVARHLCVKEGYYPSNAPEIN